MTSDFLEEKTLESKQIYDGRVVHLYLDTVQLPNGKTSLREVVRHNGAVAVVPIDRDGNVILVQQYRHPARRVLLEIPAGTLNVGEDPDTCVERELQEETGYKPGKIIKLGGSSLPLATPPNIFISTSQRISSSHVWIWTRTNSSK